MRLWLLIAKEGLEDLEAPTNEPKCQICGKSFDPFDPIYGDGVICPDCAKALNEMITWWNDTARDWWVKNNAKKDRE